MKKIFNFTIGLLIIFAILFFCKFILNISKITFPASILGIIILFLLLKFEIIKENYIKDFCEFILKYMILFFIPAFVGIINYLDIVSKNLWVVLLTVFLTTALIIIFIGFFVEYTIKFKRLYKMKKGIQK